MEDAFRYGKIVLATTTYNGDIFPYMREFIEHLTERNYQNRTIGLMENGSWAPQAAKIMRRMLEECKNITFLEPVVTVRFGVKEENIEQIRALAAELLKGNKKMNTKATRKLTYGLFLLTAKDGEKDNGCIINTATQVANEPTRIAISVINSNYTCDLIKKSGIFNLSALDTSATFPLYQRFGMQSGRDADKFEGFADLARSENGLYYLTAGANAFLSCKVVESMDLGSHTLFIGELVDAEILGSGESASYAYYQDSVKPKPQPKTDKKTWVCQVCGYVYEGDEVPDDFDCPLCHHGKEDFVLQ